MACLWARVRTESRSREPAGARLKGPPSAKGNSDGPWRTGGVVVEPPVGIGGGPSRGLIGHDAAAPPNPHLLLSKLRPTGHGQAGRRPLGALSSRSPAMAHAMKDSGLEAVFLNNRATLLRFLRARGAGEGAEDLLQEMWIRASAGASGPVADPLAYLYRVANNLLLDRRRAELRPMRAPTAGPARSAWSGAAKARCWAASFRRRSRAAARRWRFACRSASGSRGDAGGSPKPATSPSAAPPYPRAPPCPGRRRSRSACGPGHSPGPR